MDGQPVVFWIVAGVFGLIMVVMVVAFIGAELDLSTPIARWRNVAIASAAAVVAGGLDSGFSGWDLVAAAVVLAVVVETFFGWLSERKRRR